ncbi:MAG: hypothetical protein ACHQUC_05400 [Chlamydiales bacterium]
MNTEQWKEWNEAGFIPGMTESEDEFIKRVSFCKNLQQELTENVGTELPFDVSDQASNEIRQEAISQTKTLYGIAPEWVPIFFNNHQLAPWHGGCAWIFQLNEQTPTSAFLQLRAAFREKSSYLGMYQRRELIAHELSHVGRMLYHEPQFEEIIAYRSSASKWRRYLGPIVQSSKESLFFIIFLGLIFLTNLALITMGTSLAYAITYWLPTIPLAFILLALARLVRRQSIFHGCQQRLTEVLGDSQKAEHLIYRLSDDEIRLFARLTPNEIRTYIDSQTSFRWRFITISL